MAEMILTGLCDADGNPVTPDMRPPDVTALPRFTPPIIGTPREVEVYYLGGNWYGDGPCAVLWHTKRKCHVVLPVSRIRDFGTALKHLKGSPRSRTASGYMRGFPHART
jgi:hypothetical protein